MKGSVKARRHISMRTKLAAALCQMMRPDENGKLVRVIDHETAKALTEDQVLSIFAYDHDPIPKHRDGPDTHWNLVPRPIPEHREKTAKVDVPGAAKDKRIMERQAEFRRKMLAKAGIGEIDGESPSKSPKQKRRWKLEGTRFNWRTGRYEDAK